VSRNRRLSNEAVSELSAAIEELIAQGKCTPQALVDSARDAASVLHKYFEWDDAKAAEQYRLTQARYYMRSINIEYVTEECGIIEMRAFVPTYVDGQGNLWKPAVEVAATEEGMEQLLRAARRELRAFTKKYAALRAYAQATSMLSAIDQFLGAAE
jgi:hypothetical protein